MKTYGAAWNRNQAGEYRLDIPGYRATIVKVGSCGQWWRSVHASQNDKHLVDTSFTSGTLKRAKEVIEDAIREDQALTDEPQ